MIRESDFMCFQKNYSENLDLNSKSSEMEPYIRG
jgi:hypothetical protein